MISLFYSSRNLSDNWGMSGTPSTNAEAKCDHIPRLLSSNSAPAAWKRKKPAPNLLQNARIRPSQQPHVRKSDDSTALISELELRVTSLKNADTKCGWVGVRGMCLSVFHSSSCLPDDWEMRVVPSTNAEAKCGHNPKPSAGC